MNRDQREDVHRRLGSGTQPWRDMSEPLVEPTPEQLAAIRALMSGPMNRIAAALERIATAAETMVTQL